MKNRIFLLSIGLLLVLFSSCMSIGSDKSTVNQLNIDPLQLLWVALAAGVGAFLGAMLWNKINKE